MELEMTHKAQYYYTRRVISKLIGSGSNDFRFMPEFMLNGRIHYHGWLDITNVVSWQRISLPSINKLGRSKIEYNLTDKWYAYMNKSIEDTRKILGFKPDISLSVTKDDYIQWKKDNSEQPTLVKFDIKPKILPRGTPCPLPYNKSNDTLATPSSFLKPPYNSSNSDSISSLCEE